MTTTRSVSLRASLAIAESLLFSTPKLTIAGFGDSVNKFAWPCTAFWSSITKSVRNGRLCSGYANPNRNMIKNGPSTKVRMSRGWRKISTSSFRKKEEIRIRNLNMGGLPFDDSDEYIVKRRRFFLNCFHCQAFCLSPFHQQRNGCAGFFNYNFNFLVINRFHFA